MIDAVKTLRDIRIQHILGLLVDRDKDRTDGIVGGATGTEAVAVGCECGFPFWFQRQFHQSLQGSVMQRWNTSRALLIRPALRSPHPPEGLAVRPPPQVVSQSESLGRVEGFDAINPRGVLPVLVVGDPADCQELGSPRLQ